MRVKDWIKVIYIILYILGGVLIIGLAHKGPWMTYAGVMCCITANNLERSHHRGEYDR